MYVSRIAEYGRHAAFSAFTLALGAVLMSPPRAGAQELPWMDKSLAPARRAELLIGAMTLDQKIQQLHGQAGVVPEVSGCGNPMRHIPGIPELKIPTFRITSQRYLKF